MKSKNRWTTKSTCSFNLGYHIIFCPKYRRKVLTPDIAQRLKELCFEKAEELGIDIKEINIMPDHIHMFIKSPPNYAPHFIIAQIKGFTSRMLRKEFKILTTRIPTMWTRSYYIESVGCISEETIRRYIENQKGK